jgi:hypothetical protein
MPVQTPNISHPLLRKQKQLSQHPKKQRLNALIVRKAAVKKAPSKRAVVKAAPKRSKPKAE